MRNGLFWAAGLALATTITLSRPVLRDPDSTLYAAMSTQLASRPLTTWIAPDWPEGRAKTGRFVEHTAVSLWPGAAIERAGLSAGALVANLLCAVLLLWLVGRLAACLEPRAQTLAWAAWGLSLVGIQFWLRANHEIWWATASLGALLGVAARWPRWAVVACTVGAFSIKGPLGLDTLLLVAPLAWVTHGRRWLLLYLAFAAIAVVAFGALYDAAFHQATGSSFIEEYASIQFGYVEQAETHSFLTRPRNLAVYIGKLVWFSLPGALLLGWTLVTRRGWRSEPGTRSARALMLGVLLVLIVTSFMSRQAGRYIFPCYPLLAVIGAVSMSGMRLGAWIAPRGRLVLALVFVVALGRVLFAHVVYREVNLLPGTRVTSTEGPKRQ